jgi:hypothetical protein
LESGEEVADGCPEGFARAVGGFAQQCLTTLLPFALQYAFPRLALQYAFPRRDDRDWRRRVRDADAELRTREKGYRRISRRSGTRPYMLGDKQVWSGTMFTIELIVREDGRVAHESSVIERITSISSQLGAARDTATSLLNSAPSRFRDRTPNAYRVRDNNGNVVLRSWEGLI